MQSSTDAVAKMAGALAGAGDLGGENNLRSTTPSSSRIAVGAVERHVVTDRESWLRMRLRDITASDVASICGVGFRSPLAVWAEKKGLVSGTADNAILQRGRWFEPAIWAALKDHRPSWEIRAAKIYLRSPALRLGATPDALAIDPSRNGIVLIQGKVVARPIFERDWLDGHGSEPEVPLQYQLQTLTETMLAESYHKEIVHPVLVALVVDSFHADLHVIPVQRHAAAEARILEAVKNFWRDFDAGKEPSVLPGGEDHRVIKALYPNDDGTTVDLSSDNMIPTLMDERKAITAQISALKSRKDDIEAEIKAKIGTATFAMIASGRKLSLKVTTVGPKLIDGYEFRALREVKVR